MCTVLGAPGLDLPFSFRFQLVDCKGLLQENCELSPHSPSAFGFEIQPPTVGPKFPRFMMGDLATAIANPFWHLRSKFFSIALPMLNTTTSQVEVINDTYYLGRCGPYKYDMKMATLVK